MEPLPQRLDIEPSNSMEALKADSRYLRGRIAEELLEPGDHFSEPTAQLLRHHGIFQQIDRDRHGQIGDPGFRLETVYQFMVRTAVPGGRLTSEQFVAHLNLSDEFAGGRLKVTARQNLELHGIAKRDLATVLRRIHATNLTTMGSCGDVVRNVVCCPAPYRSDPVHDQMQSLAHTLAADLAPRTPAYRELWLGAALQPAAMPESNEVEPLYGPTYLPGKLKIAIGLPGDNCADVYAHDIGLLSICEDFRVVGYNLLVGGGMDSDDVELEPSLAQRLGFVPAGQALNAVLAIVRLYRDFGNRTQCQRARLRDLIQSWGIDRFKAQVEAYCGLPMAEPRPDDVWDIDDHIGWHEQGDGRWFYGIHLPNGRIEDTHRGRWRTALRDICSKYFPSISLTSGQNIIVGDIRWEDRLDLEDQLRRNELRLESELSPVRRWATACASLPTCPRALTESERALPGLLEQLESELARRGMQGELFSLHMSGCAHGCTRPHSADVGIIGRGAGRYAVILGGRRLGDRIGFVYRDSVPLEQIVTVLAEVLDYFKLHRKAGEQLGDFCHRVGLEGLGTTREPLRQ